MNSHYHSTNLVLLLPFPLFLLPQIHFVHLRRGVPDVVQPPLMRHMSDSGEGKWQDENIHYHSANLFSLTFPPFLLPQIHVIHLRRVTDVVVQAPLKRARMSDSGNSGNSEVIREMKEQVKHLGEQNKDLEDRLGACFVRHFAAAQDI